MAIFILNEFLLFSGVGTLVTGIMITAANLLS
jgi:hypothetical protein